MRPALLVTLLMVVPLAAGCVISPYREPQSVEVAGTPDGLQYTSGALKLLVLTADGTTRTVAFDRGEWYDAGLEREITHKRVHYLSVTAMEKNVLFEVDATAFVVPEDWTERFRYDHLKAKHTEAELLAMDREWDDLVTLHRDAPEVSLRLDKATAVTQGGAGNATAGALP